MTAVAKKEVKEVHAVRIFSEKEKQDYLKQLKDAVDDHQKSQWNLAILLRDAKQGEVEDGKKFYESFGYESFEDFCVGELAISERRGHYLLDIFRETEKGVLDENKIKSLPWTKSTVLAAGSRRKVITEDNVDEWYEKAQTKSYRDLRDELNAAMGKGTKKKVASIRKNDKGEDVYNTHIGLYEEQYQNWQLALQKAKNMTGSDSESHLVDTIASCFLSDTFDSKKDSIETVCERIETAFGIKLIAVDPTDTTIVYGSEFASSMG